MRIWLVVACLAAGTGAAQAGSIERACLKSDRPGISRGLCGCIQDVADRTLTRSEQRVAASFFKDPEKAEEFRMSKKDSRDGFWERYQNFGATAAAFCAGG